MAKTLNDYFKQYNDLIMLKDSDYKTMREKREIVLDEIRSDKDVPSFKHLSLGSYKLKTGVKYNDNDFDLDCGILFNIKSDEMYNTNAKKYKNLVFDAISNIREKKYKTKCVSVKYVKENSPVFHLDFPVFAYDEEEELYYLADGKQHENVKWVQSYPKEIIEYLDLKYDDYKRIVRLLKKWNNKATANERQNVSAPSIALTVEARDWFGNNEYEDDISTLISIFEKLKNLSSSGTIYRAIDEICSDNLYFKMNSNRDDVLKFNEIVSNALSILKSAKEKSKTSMYDAWKEIKTLFPDFPEPDKEAAEKSFSPNSKYA